MCVIIAGMSDEDPGKELEGLKPEIVTGKEVSRSVRGWPIMVNARQQKIFRIAGTFGLLSFAGWLLQNFLQLRGVVDLIASRVCLALLWLCLCVVVWIATAAIGRRLILRILLVLLSLVIVVWLDQWAPKPVAHSKPTVALYLTCSPSGFPLVTDPGEDAMRILGLSQKLIETGSQSFYTVVLGTGQRWPDRHAFERHLKQYHEIGSLAVFRCEATNHGPQVLLDVWLTADLYFGQSKIPDRLKVNVGPLDPIKPFRFNLMNACGLDVTGMWEDIGSAELLGDRRQIIDVRSTYEGLSARVFMLPASKERWFGHVCAEEPL